MYEVHDFIFLCLDSGKKKFWKSVWKDEDENFIFPALRDPRARPRVMVRWAWSAVEYGYATFHPPAAAQSHPDRIEGCSEKEAKNSQQKLP